MKAVARARGEVHTYRLVSTAQRCSIGTGIGVVLILVVPLVGLGFGLEG